ncbi:MAG: beta-galactosidase [Clostridia bacterium]|nr:beta-galactosidase [Clostridia bacterium]
MKNQHTYSYNPMHLLRDGKPWLPTMGEMQFSRCQRVDWRSSIRLMKAGGVDILASYVFWIHHEPTRGTFDFSGCRDIRAFLDICEEEEMPVLLRIGPWCHGECRNGGFPDWLQHGVAGLRTNAPEYMERVRIFWKALYGEIKDHIGGCIIGLQIENEYKRDEAEHMTALEALADEIGIRAPFHTATGWGSAYIGSGIPVFGGYPDEPWHWSSEQLPPSVHYLFTPIRDDSNIGANEVSGEQIIKYPPRFNQDDFPYLTAEIGGGCQPTLHRRPIATGCDIAGIVSAKLGSGTVLPGIYVYHGGTNPDLFLNESRASGSHTDIPDLNYDFQSPISEYGKAMSGYFELRRIFTFLRDFGAELATMPSVFPADNPTDPADLENLRYCYRTNGNSGYLFVNNYVRHYETKAQTRTFRIPTESGDVIFPEMTFSSGDFGFYPYNLSLGNAKLCSTNAQPLCVLNGKTYVFFTDRQPVYNIEGELGEINILTINSTDALHASKVTLGGKEYLLICEAPYTQDGDRLTFSVTKDTALSIYPAPDGSKDFAEYTLTCPVPDITPTASLSLLSENPLMREFSLKIEGDVRDAYDLLMDIDYGGNIIELFLDGKKVADQYSLGNGWQVGLRRFGNAKNFTLRLFSLFEDSDVYIERKPDFKRGVACEIYGIRLTPEYQVDFTIEKMV